MSKNSHIKARILAYLEHKEMTEYEFYKNSKLSRGILKHPSGISEDNITKFLAYDRTISYGERVSLNWLMRGQGEMFEPIDPAADFIVNDPETTYDGNDREKELDDLVNKLDVMTQSYTYALAQVTERIKLLKGEE